MPKVKMTSFKAKLGFTVARINLILNEFSPKLKRYQHVNKNMKRRSNIISEKLTSQVS